MHYSGITKKIYLRIRHTAVLDSDVPQENLRRTSDKTFPTSQHTYIYIYGTEGLKEVPQLGPHTVPEGVNNS